MRPEDYAVDNASDVDNPYDTHPCGPGHPLSHSFVKGFCEDCGAEDEEYPTNLAGDISDTDEEYDAWKDDRLDPDRNG